MLFVLTAAAKQWIQDHPGQLPVMSEFRVGSGFGYFPTDDMTGLQGDVLYTGTPSGKSLPSGTFLYEAVMDSSVGPFHWGEVGFYRNEVLFAIGSQSTQAWKAATIGSITGSNAVISAYVHPSSELSAAEVGNSSNELNVHVVPNIAQLPPAHLAFPNVVLVPSPIAPTLSVLATASGRSWSLAGWESMRFQGNLVSATANTLTIGDDVPPPSLPGEYLISILSGPASGLVRSAVAYDAVAKRFTLDQPLPVNPLAGDTVRVMQSSLASSVENLPPMLWQLDPRLAASDINQLVDLDMFFSPLLRRDGLSYMTGNLNLDENRITSLADPVDEQDAVTKSYADSLVVGLASTQYVDSSISTATSGLASTQYVDDNFGKSLNLDPTDGLQIGGAAPNAEQRAAVRAGIGAAKIGRGNRFAFFGDSITGFGLPYPAYAEVLSIGKINAVARFSHSGYTSGQLVSVVTEVTTLATKPSKCVLLIGTNDAQTGVSVPTYRANMVTIITALIADGIEPVLCTLPPIGIVGYRGNVTAINAQLAVLASLYDLELVDFYSALVNPADGDWAAGYDSGDGVHPSDAARVVMAQTLVNSVSGGLPTYRPDLAADANDPNNLLPNALGLTDADVNGLADGWSNYNPGVTGVTYSLEDDASIKGKWHTQTLSAANGVGFLEYRKVGGFSAGDTLALNMLVKTASLAAANSQLWIYAIWWADYGGTVVRADTLAGGYSQNIAKGLLSTDLVAPAGATQVSLQVKPGPGNGVYAIAQPTMRNLTALGIS